MNVHHNHHENTHYICHQTQYHGHDHYDHHHHDDFVDDDDEQAAQARLSPPDPDIQLAEADLNPPHFRTR